MSDNEYYLLHGLMLDSDHESKESAVQRAHKLMSDNGTNHSIIKIGKRDESLLNDIFVMYYRLSKYPLEGTIS